MLKDHNVKYERYDNVATFFSGTMEAHRIAVLCENGEWLWDFVCSTASYGAEEAGLLEYWSKPLSDAGEDPAGWLTAEQVIWEIEKDGYLPISQ